MRIGIIGTGRIAKRALKEMLHVQGIVPVAVYNPNIEHAKEFSAWAESEYDSLKNVQTENMDNSVMIPLNAIIAAGSIQEFKEIVDAVYIATPHSTHYDYAKDMLLAGKHVICEKPMALRREEAEELFVLARTRRLVLMEGIKTAFCPGFKKIEEVVTNGIIGEVVDVEAAFTRLTEYGCREFDDLLYGGSFTEFGTYTLLPIFRFIGTGYTGISVMSVPAGTGVDGYTKVVFFYIDLVSTDSGVTENVDFKLSTGIDRAEKSISDTVRATATAKTGLTAKSEGQLLITGTKGYILVPSPWWLTRYFEVRFEDAYHIEKYECEFEGDGLRYEFLEFLRRIRERDPEAGTGPGDQQVFSLEEKEALARAGVYERFLEKRRC